MAKVLKIASAVLSVAAVVAPFFGPPGWVVTALSAASVAAGVGSAVAAKKPQVSGQTTTWRADPGAPSTITFGRTLVGGDIRYKKAHDKNNRYDTLVVVLSGCGPIQSIDATYADKRLVNFTGTAAQAPWRTKGQPRDSFDTTPPSASPCRFQQRRTEAGRRRRSHAPRETCRSGDRPISLGYRVPLLPPLSGRAGLTGTSRHAHAPQSQRA